MPSIDLTSSSYRALLRAAHRRHLSVSAFLGSALHALELAADGVSTDTGSNQSDAARKTIRVRPRKAWKHRDDVLWAKIWSLAGRSVTTKRGEVLTFRTDGEYAIVDGPGTRIPRSQFEKAAAQWPVDGPSAFTGVYAPSIVWAVLNALAAGDGTSEPGRAEIIPFPVQRPATRGEGDREELEAA